MERKATSSTWGVLVVGLGWGRLLANAVAKRDDTKVLAVADVDGGKAERCGEEFAAAAFTDYRKAVNQPGLHTALIALPAHLHKEAALACIERGLHVYVEKPVGHQDKPEEVLEIAEAARAAGVKFMPGFSQRFAAYAQAALDVVHSAALGTVLSVDILRQSYFGPEWTEAPGWGVHDYYLCNLLAGAPPNAVTAFSPAVGAYGTGLTTEVLVEHKNGVISRCKTSMFATRHEEIIRVLGDQGELVSKHVAGTMQVWTREKEWEILHHKDPGFVENAIRHYFNYLADNEVQPVSPEEAFQGRQILNAVWESLTTGERILLLS